jgi:DNA-binding winged helix-turn-helix (wHTH) protein
MCQRWSATSTHVGGEIPLRLCLARRSESRDRLQHSSDLDSVVCFGVFQLNLEAHELRKRGLQVKLTEQSFQLLAALIENSGEIQTRAQLGTKLWPQDAAIDLEHSLNKAIHELRQALGDPATDPRFIETIPGKGYRFAPIVKRRADNEISGEKLKSVAILLVEAPGEDSEIAFLARRLTATSINLLSRESNVRVLAYNTVRNYHFAGKDPLTIGTELAVKHVVLSEILQRHMGIDIHSELIDTSDGSLLCAIQQKRSKAEFAERIEDVAAEMVRTFHSVLKSGSKEKLGQKRPVTLNHQPRQALRIRGSKAFAF